MSLYANINGCGKHGGLFDDTCEDCLKNRNYMGHWYQPQIQDATTLPERFRRMEMMLPVEKIESRRSWRE